MIEPGQKAPDFQLPDQDGKPVKLSGLRGRPVVLYFYPKAGTPGCTTQACGVRDHAADYRKAGATVLGVSKDPVPALKRFQAEHGLRHPLLSDEDHKVAEAYGAWVEKSMYGRKHMGVARSTFVIDAKGRVAHVIPKANPRSHDREVLEALEAL
jgi:peroxiredoxin Q/BCP